MISTLIDCLVEKIISTMRQKGLIFQGPKRPNQVYLVLKLDSHSLYDMNSIVIAPKGQVDEVDGVEKFLPLTSTVIEMAFGEKAKHMEFKDGDGRMYDEDRLLHSCISTQVFCKDRENQCEYVIALTNIVYPGESCKFQ